MLLFLTDEPTNDNERDGMLQRVKWVDDQFKDVPRVLLSISIKRNLRRRRIERSRIVAVEKLNLFVHFRRILNLARRSDFVYVHSCFHAFRALPLYFLGRAIITDMHGAVPEELALNENKWMSRVMSIVEKVVVRKSSALVFVTEAMRQHFRTKYGFRKDLDTYVVPIISDELRTFELKTKDPFLVIYAGGLQAWQRVDLMLDAVEHAPNEFKFLFLTGTPMKLKSILTARGLLNAKVDSVPRSEIFRYYSDASLGFILRQDSTVNRVACPTKLVEYLCSGVIPIVEQPSIGDFLERGYQYILVQDFMKGRMPDIAKIGDMGRCNKRIVQEFADFGLTQFASLRARYSRIDKDA